MKKINISLIKSKKGDRGYISSIDGDNHLIARITSIGLSIGCEVEIMQNYKKRPVLLYERDTVLAVNREAAKKIMMEKVN